MLAANSNTPSDKAAPRAVRALLVEDSPDNQFLFRAFGKKIRCDMDLAENGAVGVEKFQAGHYDLVLMDMQMPVMDGYTAMRTIREWEKEQGRNPTPIVALTANATQEMAEKSLAGGCNAYFTKPISCGKFLGIIAEYAERER
jgi:two-component system sensor histidine kinase/response regulator